MSSRVEWVRRNFIYYLGISIIAFLAIIGLLSREVSAQLFFTTLAILTYGGMIRFTLKQRAQMSFEAQLQKVSSLLQADPERARRAEELFISAGYYQRRAANNNTAAILVLLVLAVSVAFVGYILNLDTVQFASLNSYVSELDKRRETIRYYGTTNEKSKETKETLDQMVSDLKPLQDEYQKALSAQTSAETGMTGPTYRIASAIIIRISILGVGIYLVVLLNRAYKFNSSLSSFYRSRFLSCLRGDENMEEFAKFAALVSAEAIDYKVDIEHPADRLIAIFDKISNMFARDRANKKNP